MINENDDFIVVNSTDHIKSDGRVYSKYLPDIIISNIPVELQELRYSADGKGHRASYGYQHTTTLDFTNPKFPAPLKAKLHKHNYFELVFVASGKLNMQIESKLCKLSSLDVCILNCATRHAEEFFPDACIYYIVLPVDYLKESLKKNGLSLRNSVLFGDFLIKDLDDTLQQNKDYVISRNVNPEVLMRLDQNIRSIREEFQEKRPGFQLIVRGLLFRFLSVLANPEFYETKYIDLGADNGFPLAYSAKKILDEHKHKMTVHEISKRLNYSEEHVNRVFKKQYGLTIPEYNKSVCLHHAAFLLKNTDLHVHTICAQLGFSNRTNFYKLFKDEYGYTPSEYRKKGS